MEELGALAAIALASALALAIADIAGWMMGLGWRHYSKKAFHRRASKETRDV